MSTFLTLVAMSALPVFSLLGMAGLYRAGVFFVRGVMGKNPLRALSVFMVLLLCCGGGVVWLGMNAWEKRTGDPLLPLFRMAIMGEYLAGVICYIEMVSLLSRGYSQRILVDVVSCGGTAGIKHLKANYSDGMGISGILTKRLNSLKELHFLSFDGVRVGPLTLLGKVTGICGSWVRGLLRLERVG